MGVFLPSHANLHNVLVRVGSTKAWDGGILVKVVQIIQHENFNKPQELDHDIALLKIDRKLKWSNNIKCIDLPSKDEDVKPGTDCTLAGWGNKSSLHLHEKEKNLYRYMYITNASM